MIIYFDGHRHLGRCLYCLDNTLILNGILRRLQRSQVVGIMISGIITPRTRKYITPHIQNASSKSCLKFTTKDVALKRHLLIIVLLKLEMEFPAAVIVDMIRKVKKYPGISTSCLGSTRTGQSCRLL